MRLIAARPLRVEAGDGGDVLVAAAERLTSRCWSGRIVAASCIA
jgi:hypothetical protein